MSEISGNITYSRFINDMLNKLRLSDDDYLRLASITYDGMDELELNYLANFKDAKVTVDTDTNTIDFPSDFVNFISISIPWEGRMWTWTRDDRLVITTDGTQGVDEVYDVNDGEGVNVADNGVVQGLGSRGAVNKYFYTIDRRRGRIAFSGYTPDNVILRYKSTNIDDTTTNYIPKVARRCLEYYVRYMDADYQNAPAVKVQQLEMKYKDEVRKLKKNIGPNVTEIRDMIRRTASQTVRR